jgi:precorrin-6y C5,15-methyltransferase (decarboxylating) CbiE subunit
LTPAAWQILRQAQVVAGGKRQLEQFLPPGVEQIVVGADITTLITQLRSCQGKRVAVLASGDPGCFGLLATLRREAGDLPWQVLPGISSMQLALARLGESWEGVVFTSAHGRDLRDVVETARTHTRVLALTDPKQPAQTLAAALVAAGLERSLVVLERLGYPEERLTRGTAAEIAAGTFDPLAVVWIEEK